MHGHCTTHLWYNYIKYGACYTLSFVPYVCILLYTNVYTCSGLYILHILPIHSSDTAAVYIISVVHNTLYVHYMLYTYCYLCAMSVYIIIQVFVYLNNPHNRVNVNVNTSI